MTDFIIRLVRFAHLYLVRKTSFVFIDMKNHVGDIGKSYRRNTRNKYKKYVKHVHETQETCTTVAVITYLNRESPVLGFSDSQSYGYL